MIETFSDCQGENAHDRFQQWRERHYKDGFFLNPRSPGDVMLHRSACSHLKGTDWGPWRRVKERRRAVPVVASNAHDPT